MFRKSTPCPGSAHMRLTGAVGALHTAVVFGFFGGSTYRGMPRSRQACSNSSRNSEPPSTCRERKGNGACVCPITDSVYAGVIAAAPAALSIGKYTVPGAHESHSPDPSDRYYIRNRSQRDYIQAELSHHSKPIQKTLPYVTCPGSGAEYFTDDASYFIVLSQEGSCCVQLSPGPDFTVFTVVPEPAGVP